MIAAHALPVVAGSILGDVGGEVVDKGTYRQDSQLTPAALMLPVFGAMMAALTAVAVIVGVLGQLTAATVLSVPVLAVVAGSFAGNVASYRSLAVNTVSLRTPALGMVPVIAGAIGVVVQPTTGLRTVGTVVLLAVAGVVVWWGTSRRDLATTGRRGLAWLAVCVCCNAAMPALYAVALTELDPVPLALVRVAGVLGLTIATIRTRPALTAITIGRGTASGVLYAISAVAGIYAVHGWGIAGAVAIALATPAATLIASRTVLHETPHPGEIASSLILAIVGVCVGVVAA